MGRMIRKTLTRVIPIQMTLTFRTADPTRARTAGE
jgi:hypothetical protein